MIRKILIVEPDPKLARDMFLLFHFERGRFERERYEPEVAGSIVEAAERVQATDFHCIIMDVNLPEMNGYDAVSFIKTISKNTPIIVSAEHNSLELETKMRQQDVYYYHVRSFGQDELRLAVHSVFEELQNVRNTQKLRMKTTTPVVLKQLHSSLKTEQ